MIVTQTGNAFAFTYETITDVLTYNEWLDEIGIENAKVQLPLGVATRSLRRVLAKSGPSILRADNDQSVQLIRERWM